jgi:cobalamin biosynthesis Mg chelatase CobN
MADAARDPYALHDRLRAWQSLHPVHDDLALFSVDGRLLTRAISFKAEAESDAALEFSRVHHEPEPDRIDYVARLAAAWAKLGA